LIFLNVFTAVNIFCCFTRFESLSTQSYVNFNKRVAIKVTIQLRT